MPDLIDRAGEQVRLLMGEDRAPSRARATPGPLGTGNLTAWRHYTAGLACFEQRSFAGSFDECLAEMKKAVNADPGFAMAHLQVAKLLFLGGHPRALQKQALDQAREHIERVPPVDRPKLAGWTAFVDGRDAEAKALFQKAAEAAPDDKYAWFLAAKVHYHRDEFAGALPFLRRAVALDPLWLDAGQHLCFALGATGDTVGLRVRVAELSALGPKPDALTSLCYAQTWLDSGGSRGDLRPGAGRGSRRDRR